LRNVAPQDDGGYGQEPEPDYTYGYRSPGSGPTIGDQFGHWLQQDQEQDQDDEQ
jgi:hypothetical protein